MGPKKIGVIVGSLRRKSFSLAIAKAAAALAPDDMEMHFVDISRLQMFNQDIDEAPSPPEEWASFRKETAALDGFLFVTPEYNRSVPAVLKNALDIGSRPFVSNVWDGKPGAVISVSPGGMGGFGANHHLRQTMMALNLIPLQQPEAYIRNVEPLLDESGAVTKEGTLKFLKTYMEAFAKLVRTLSPAE